MRSEIHPVYTVAKVICACGNTFETRSTKEVIKLELCSACHPFFTGQQRLIDTAGRVERFRTRFKKTEGRMVVRKAVRKVVRKVLPDNRAGRRRVLTTAPTKADIKKEKKTPVKKA